MQVTDKHLHSQRFHHRFLRQSSCRLKTPTTSPHLQITLAKLTPQAILASTNPARVGGGRDGFPLARRYLMAGTTTVPQPETSNSGIVLSEIAAREIKNIIQQQELDAEKGPPPCWRQGRRLLGLQLSSRPHRDPEGHRRDLRAARDQDHLRSQEHALPERCDHRFQGRNHGPRVCLPQSQRHLVLRVRFELLRLNSPANSTKSETTRMGGFLLE
jgi:hypothetical protein